LPTSWRKFFHRVVHRVGNGARDVLGHRGFLGQITFSHCLQFVHQPQNGRLVGVVDALGFLLLAFGFEPLLFGNHLALAAVLQLHIGQSHRTKNSEQTGDRQAHPTGTGTQTASAQTACPAGLPATGAAAHCRQ
jgi:hypothetical protein